MCHWKYVKCQAEIMEYNVINFLFIAYLQQKQINEISDKEMTSKRSWPLKDIIISLRYSVFCRQPK